MDKITCLLFDWGDTLMLDDPQYTGSMAFWDTVSPMPGVAETLPLLHKHFKCIVASNAGDSDAALMRQAFRRVDLDQYFAGFITSKELNATKPSPAFYQGILDRYSLSSRETVMIGNDYGKDIIGAKSVGLKTIFITKEQGSFPHADYIISSFEQLLDIFDLRNIHPTMSAPAVLSLLTLFEQHAIEVHVDGGWGVDALLGEQTRNHEDLDIALPHKYVPKLRALLAARGYAEVPRPDSWECNFVLGDAQGHLVDVHSYTFDDNGNNIFGVAYEPHHLTGNGTIGGHPVRTIPPDIMVEFHTGYDVDENDYRDVKALCERFGIALPVIYEKFETT